MNHIYRVVFNQSLGVYQCVSELAKSHGKSSSSKSQSTIKFLLTPLAIAILGLSGQAIAADFVVNKDQRTIYDKNLAIDGNVLITGPKTVISAPNNEINFGIDPKRTTDVSIKNGAVIEADVSSLGANGPTTVTVNKASFNADIVGIGANSSGTLNIINNANLNVGNSIFMGFTPVKSRFLNILNINSGGKVVTDRIDVAKVVNTNAAVLISGIGSKLTAQDAVTIGDKGVGYLSVDQGGELTTTTLAIANDLGSAGSSVEVNGAGSNIKVDGITFVGLSENGRLSIRGGGQVTSDTVLIGGLSTAQGTLNIDGIGSTLNNSTALIVGAQSIGTINATNNATLNSASTEIGQALGAVGKVSLTSGAKWNNENFISVGSYGEGVLEVAGPTTKVNTNDLTVGFYKGQGKVNITDNATVKVNRLLQIGGFDDRSVDSVGEVTVNNANLSAPITVVGALGSGTLNIINNGVVKTEAIGRYTNSKKSDVNFDKGTLELTESKSQLFNNFTSDNTIKLGLGGGTINTNEFIAELYEEAVITGKGNFTKAGKGTLVMAMPSKQWTGTTNIDQGLLVLDGDYVMRNGENLGIGLNSLDDYGQLLVLGNADISKGQLQINASEAVGKMTGSNEWKNIVLAESVTGKFSAITDNSPLVSFQADYSDASAVSLKMVAPTPEPPVVVPPVKPEPPVVVPPVKPEPPVVVPPVKPEPPVVVPPVKPEPPVVVPPVKPEPPVADTTFVKAIESQTNQTALGLASVLDQAIEDRINNGNNELADALISNTLNFDKPKLAAAANELQPLLMGAANRFITDSNYTATEALTERSLSNPQRGLWAKIIGSNSSHDEESGITGYDADSYGAIVGIDTPINDNLRLGVAFSYIDSDVDSNSSTFNHEMTAKNWQILGYGNYAASEATQVNFHAGAGSSDVKGERNLSILTEAIASSDYSVDTLQAGFGIGHRIGNELRSFTPFAQMNYARAESDGYRETGAGVYNLEVDENTYESLRWTAGVKMSQALTPKLALTGQLAAALENGDRRSDITASFIDTPGANFTTSGQEIGQEIGIVGVGLSYMPTANTKLSAGYRGEWRENYNDQGASIALQTTF
uniref:autotransporter outer membrane beta-barrel domain-containing protein n=1 Tax=Psychrobacter sp. TaxID=56811 RepID=UPI00159A5E18|nr:autotransporter outer membrane beta-barrel domain-containing protein [Psychrobacter sp.]QJS05082.1 autotransporter beta-domain [Psychrobacter sp.]